MRYQSRPATYMRKRLCRAQAEIYALCAAEGPFPSARKLARRAGAGLRYRLRQVARLLEIGALEETPDGIRANPAWFDRVAPSEKSRTKAPSTWKNPAPLFERGQSDRTLAQRAAQRFWLPNDADHADLMQVGIIQIWRSRQEGITEEAMLVRKARWAMVDYLRTTRHGRRRHPVTMESIDHLGDTTHGKAAVQIACPLPSPEEIAADNDDVAKLRQALRLLGPKQRAAVVGRLSGEIGDDLGAELGVSAPRVSQIINEATAKLRRALRPSAA